MNHPYILTEAEYQKSIRKQAIKSYIGGTVLALFIAALLSMFSGCAEQDLRDKRIASAAFFPSKPSYAAQSAYREDAREQLRLNQNLKAHAAGN